MQIQHYGGKKVVNIRYLDRQALQTLGLVDDIVWIFGNIGWQQFLEMMRSTYIPLTLEYFSSLEVKVSLYSDSDPGQITF